MQLISFGGPAVKFISKSPFNQSGELVIFCNPYGSCKGLPKLRKQTAQIVLASKQDKAYYEKTAHSADAFVIDSPGEYEIKNVFINAQETGDDKDKIIVFRLDVEGVSFGFLAGLLKTINGPVIEYLEGVDVLLIPVGGGDVLNASQAMAAVNQLEPRVIIPIQYRSKHYPIAYNTVNNFVKEFGTKEFDTVNKLKIGRKDLPVNERRLILLE